MSAKKNTGLSRRDAIKTVAAVSTLASVAPSQFYAGENNTIQIALVGCGGRGTGAAGQALLADKNVKLVAMADAFSDYLENSLNNLKSSPVCGAIMTRVQKGSRSRPSLVCRSAKAGAGCPYRSVSYEQVEHALIRGLPSRLSDSEGVEFEEGLEQEIVNADHTVDHLKEVASNLLENLSHEVSPALAARLREIEIELEEASARLQALLERREEASGPLVASRIARALEALLPADGAIEPAVVNAALRGIFKRAVINWPVALWT